ncbi:hypothetical protein V502_08100 [Pseudogymnoascus sp. VKM F-4520 (FW-2644)]|nr:hypothetical protein V502_08100 [Pseudogymnoascus sp. VKM F-4520 (FW-2644)]
MVGTQKWSMEEILWVITMVKQGLKDEEIYEKFCEIFKNARHVRGASSIKYCRTGFMKQEEYCQERYWEDTPGKIGFVLGRHDAGVYNGQVVADVMHHFPTHTWPLHIKPLARFSGYTRENPLVEPVLRLAEEGVSPEKIFETANENGISLDDIYYIMARFGMEVKSRPTAWDNSNYGHHYGASSAGASTSQAAPGNGTAGPLIFQLPPSDSYKKSKAHGPQHNSHRSSDTSSRLSHRGHGYEYINREGNQVAYHGVQRDLGTSLLNSGYPQGIPSEASSQAQLRDLQRRPRPELLQPSQQHGMGFHYPHISQDGQLQHPMIQQRFGQRDFQEYTGYFPNSTMQPTPPGQFHQQNWGHDPTFGRQQRVPKQPQNSFLDYQQAPGNLGQRNYGSSSQAGLVSYQPRPGHSLNQAFYSHPQQILTQERQQPVMPATGYENIDPALLRMDTNQPSRPDISIMTLLQPPLTPRIAPQDFLHPFAYSGIQSGQDISPLTIENPQFPVLLPPSPEVTHDGLEHRGQSTIPDPFAQRSVLTEQPQLGFGTDLHHSSGTNGFDQDTFDQALTLSSETNSTTLGNENSRESIRSVLNIPDQRGDQERSAEGSIAEKTTHTAVEETVAGTPITNQEPLSEAQPMELDNIEEAATLEELLKLFPDLEYQNPQWCNFNYDGSMIGSGGIDHFENTFSKNNPEEHGPQDNWPCDAKSSLGAMEAVSKNLETEMAGPFLTQNSIEHNDVSDGIQCNNSGVFEDGYAPEGTCCAGHQNFECYFEVPDSDGENATVSKP